MVVAGPPTLSLFPAISVLGLEERIVVRTGGVDLPNAGSGQPILKHDAPRTSTVAFASELILVGLFILFILQYLVHSFHPLPCS